MGTVKERTQSEIVDYIRTHSRDGKLTKSMLDIANQIGYSNATVHRALKALEEKGLIEITEADKPTKPNTIIFKGESSSTDSLIAEGAEIAEHLQIIATSFTSYLSHVERALKQHEGSIMQKQIVTIADIPDTDLQLVTVRKEAAH